MTSVKMIVHEVSQFKLIGTSIDALEEARDGNGTTATLDGEWSALLTRLAKNGDGKSLELACRALMYGEAKIGRVR